VFLCTVKFSTEALCSCRNNAKRTRGKLLAASADVPDIDTVTRVPGWAVKNIDLAITKNALNHITFTYLYCPYFLVCLSTNHALSSLYIFKLKNAAVIPWQ